MEEMMSLRALLFTFVTQEACVSQCSQAPFAQQYLSY